MNLSDRIFKVGLTSSLRAPNIPTIGSDFVRPVTYLFDAVGAVTNGWAAQREQ